jgi:hypothetical protein
MGEPFSISRVISRAFDVVGRNLVTFFLLALIVQIPLSLINYYNVTTTPAGLSQQELLARTFAPQMLVAALIYVVLAVVLQAAILRGAITSLGGKSASLAECLSTGLRTFFPIVGVTILSVLGVALGFILLIVPGIMLLLRWSVAIPVRVMEGPGVLKAMGRSAELTRGHRWAILGVLVAFALISIGLSIVLGLVTAAAGMAGSAQIVVVVMTAITGMISLVLTSAASASIYFELRSIKDGVGAEQLASVFA